MQIVLSYLYHSSISNIMLSVSDTHKQQAGQMFLREKQTNLNYLLFVIIIIIIIIIIIAVGGVTGSVSVKGTRKL